MPQKHPQFHWDVSGSGAPCRDMQSRRGNGAEQGCHRGSREACPLEGLFLELNGPGSGSYSFPSVTGTVPVSLSTTQRGLLRGFSPPSLWSLWPVTAQHRAPHLGLLVWPRPGS